MGLPAVGLLSSLAQIKATWLTLLSRGRESVLPTGQTPKALKRLKCSPAFVKRVESRSCWIRRNTRRRRTRLTKYNFFLP